MTYPMNALEEATLREGIENIPEEIPGDLRTMSAYELDRRRWAGMVRRLLALLDKERAAARSLRCDLDCDACAVDEELPD